MVRRGIEVGTEWSDTIAMHIRNCEVFFSFMSPNTVASENCLDEIAFARDEHKNAWMIILDEDLVLPPGLAMRTNRFQKLFYTRHKTPDSFIDALCAPDSIRSCRAEKTEPDKSGQSNAESPAFVPVTSAAEPDKPQKNEETVYAEKALKLGDKYNFGEGIGRNPAAAAEWYRKAAEQGEVEAQSILRQFLSPRRH